MKLSNPIAWPRKNARASCVSHCCTPVARTHASNALDARHQSIQPTAQLRHAFDVDPFDCAQDRFLARVTAAATTQQEVSRSAYSFIPACGFVLGPQLLL
jgi:hypothetical protein